MSKRITIKDYRDYDENLCNNGGKYGFWTEYTETETGDFTVEYGTTADMEFCPNCGKFGRHYDYDEDRYECGDIEMISSVALDELINNFKEEENYWIEIDEI